MKFRYDPPLILKTVFNNYYWNTVNNKILVTFDDGPNPSSTELILKSLSLAGIKGLFFCIGENARKYPELIKMILAEGHSIGNHTFNHILLSSLSPEERKNQISSVSQYFLDKFDLKLAYFRPPYGKFQLSTAGLLKEIKLKNVMWSLLTYDYRNDFSIVKFAVEKYLKFNSIIVLHDSNKSKLIISDSIKFISDETQKQHYQFGAAEECLK